MAQSSNDMNVSVLTAEEPDEEDEQDEKDEWHATASQGMSVRQAHRVSEVAEMLHMLDQQARLLTIFDEAVQGIYSKVNDSLYTFYETHEYAQFVRKFKKEKEKKKQLEKIADLMNEQVEIVFCFVCECQPGQGGALECACR